MEDLPREMLTEILSRLDKPSLFQASNVCKLWRQQALTHTVDIKDIKQLEIVARNGDRLSIIKSWRHNYEVDTGFWGACEGGHKDLVNFFMARCPESRRNYIEGLKGACRGGHKDLAELMMANGAVGCLDSALQIACRMGYKELVELMLAKGATWYNGGLTAACVGGHKELAELMLFKGVAWCSLNSGLSSACKGGYQELVKLLIDKGAKKCQCGKSIEEH